MSKHVKWKKPRAKVTKAQIEALDKRMAAAVAAGITHDSFRNRFRRDPKTEIPRIRNKFKIPEPPRHMARSGRGWAY